MVFLKEDDSPTYIIFYYLEWFDINVADLPPPPVCMYVCIEAGWFHETVRNMICKLIVRELLKRKQIQ
jgi:hypothetical protein